jgi:hypothetical protein
MKFWQYIMGTGIAVLIFSGAVFSEYSNYDAISFLEDNPFDSIGKIVYPDDSYEDFFKENGQFIRVFKRSEVEISDKSSELISGKIFLSGSFFEEKNSTINRIKLGNFVLDYSASNVLLFRDKEKEKTKILNYGRTINLYFSEDEDEEPFIIPSESMLVVSDTEELLESRNNYYYEYTDLFKLSNIDWTLEMAEELKKGVEDFYTMRTSFSKYATKIPVLWRKNNLNKLKRFSLSSSNKQGISSRIDESLLQIFEAMELLKKGDKVSKKEAQGFIEGFSMDYLLDEGLREEINKRNDWNLFKNSQKIWLPIINNNRPEWIYRRLWQSRKKGLAGLSEIIDVAEFFNFNMGAGLVDEQLLKIKGILNKIDFEQESIDRFKFSSQRRRLLFLLKNQLIVNDTIDKEVLNLCFSLIEKELIVYKNVKSLERIKREIVHDFLISIGKLIEKEDVFSREIVKESIEFLQENINLDKFMENNGSKFSEEELAIFETIKLVGTSGLTPEEIETINKIKKAEEELNKRIDKKIEEIEDSGNDIKTSKSLWKFLQEKGINLDINTFRTKHDSLSFETHFENTEMDKKKISGTFDYNSQIFRKLRLGRASINNLQIQGISIWMKSIKGKFEPIKDPEDINIDSDNVFPQNSREAIVSKQFLKKLLVSLNFSLSKNDITVISEDARDLHVKSANFSDNGITGSGISLDYNMETDKFSNVFVEEGENKNYLSKSSINGKTLREIIRKEFKQKSEKKSD